MPSCRHQTVQTVRVVSGRWSRLRPDCAIVPSPNGSNGGSGEWSVVPVAARLCHGPVTKRFKRWDWWVVSGEWCRLRARHQTALTVGRPDPAMRPSPNGDNGGNAQRSEFRNQRSAVSDKGNGYSGWFQGSCYWGNTAGQGGRRQAPCYLTWPSPRGRPVPRLLLVCLSLIRRVQR